MSSRASDSHSMVSVQRQKDRPCELALISPPQDRQDRQVSSLPVDGGRGVVVTHQPAAGETTADNLAMTRKTNCSGSTRYYFYQHSYRLDLRWHCPAMSVERPAGVAGEYRKRQPSRFAGAKPHWGGLNVKATFAERSRQLFQRKTVLLSFQKLVRECC